MDHLLKLRTACIASLILILVACGGSENTLSGAAEGGGDTGTGTDVIDDAPQAASLRLLSQNSQIPSDSSTGTVLSAIVRDANNNFLSGVNVTFQADSGGLQITNGTTDASGRATANLDAAGDPENRVITLQATADGTSVTDSIQVGVTGTTLSVVGPDSVTINDQVEYLISLRDSAGTGVSGEDVVVTSSLGNGIGAATLVTGFNGELAVTYTATNVGEDQLTVTTLGLNRTQNITISDDTFELTTTDGTLNDEGVVEVPIDSNVTVNVLWETNGAGISDSVALSTTRGVLADTSVSTDANGAASTTISSSNAGPAIITAEGNNGPTAQLKLEFIAVNPTAINLQASPSSIGPNESSTVTAILRDANGNLVKNQVIRFELGDNGAGGRISAGSAVTDSLGRAQTTYVASEGTSAKDGVVITGTVQSEPTVSSTVALTVGDKAQFVTIGSDYLITKGDGTYSYVFTVLVADSNGNPVPGVTVDLSSKPISYVTGCLLNTEETSDDEGEPLPATVCGDFSQIVGKFSKYESASCANEDVNLNGVLDTGEDANNNGVLDPGGRTLIQSSVTTDDSGTGQVTFTYPSAYALWYFYEVTATTRVEGTEASHSAEGVLLVLAADVADGSIRPPNQESPFGFGGC